MKREKKKKKNLFPCNIRMIFLLQFSVSILDNFCTRIRRYSKQFVVVVALSKIVLPTSDRYRIMPPDPFKLEKISKKKND